MNRFYSSAAIAVLLGAGLQPSPAVAQDAGFLCTPAALVDGNGDGVVAPNERVAAHAAAQPDWSFDPNGDGRTAADEFVCLGAPFAEELSPAAGLSVVTRNRVDLDEDIVRQDPARPLRLDLDGDGQITSDEWPLTAVW